MYEPWERQAGEPMDAYRAFILYRNAGFARALPTVARSLDLPMKRISTWVKTWDWKTRAEEWDAYTIQIETEEQKMALREMGKRHAKIAMQIQDKLLERLKTMKSDQLRPADIGRLFDVAVRVERLARGEPASTVASTVSMEAKKPGMNLSTLSDDELAALNEIPKKAAQREATRQEMTGNE